MTRASQDLPGRFPLFVVLCSSGSEMSSALDVCAVHLAAACLGGPWSEEHLLRTLHDACRAGGRPKWLRATVRNLIAAFPDGPRRTIDLANWLKSSQRLADRLPAISLLDLPQPTMRPHPSVANVAVPAIRTVGELADWLKLTASVVEGLAGRPVPERKRIGKARNYRYRWLEKSDGRHRLIEVPKTRLKAVQRQLLDELFSMNSSAECPFIPWLMRSFEGARFGPFSNPTSTVTGF
jgi:hypothetical protein